jgi:uncharacterized protein YcnI
MVGSMVALATIGVMSSVASAHVTIDTYGDVEQGGFAKLGFSVPNERDDAGTIEVQVQLPQDHPLPFVSVQPKPGWEVSTAMRTLDEPIEVFGSNYSEVVDTITWTASSGTRLEPGQFDLFWISVGPVPTDVDSLGFPALQTYDSGEVVRWIEATPAGGEEPEHPTPTVTVVAGSGDEHGSGSATGSATADDSNSNGNDSNDDDGDSKVLPIVALAVGAAALAIALAGRLESRRRSG